MKDLTKTFGIAVGLQAVLNLVLVSGAFAAAGARCFCSVTTNDHDLNNPYDTPQPVQPPVVASSALSPDAQQSNTHDQFYFASGSSSASGSGSASSSGGKVLIYGNNWSVNCGKQNDTSTQTTVFSRPTVMTCTQSQDGSNTDLSGCSIMDAYSANVSQDQQSRDPGYVAPFTGVSGCTGFILGSFDNLKDFSKSSIAAQGIAGSGSDSPGVPATQAIANGTAGGTPPGAQPLTSGAATGSTPIPK